MERIFGEPQAGPSGVLSTPRIMPPKPSKAEMVVQEPKRQPNMEKCLIGNREMQLPISLIEDPDVFRNVMSQHTWQTLLTDTQRKHLLKYLPSFPQNEVLEKQETLRKLFSGQNFNFGNPLEHFHERLKDGWFSPDIAKYSRLYKKAKHKEYRYQQQVYYTNLLQDLLINREKLLSAVYTGEPIKCSIKVEPDQYAPPSAQKSIKKRVRDRYTKIMTEMKSETGTGSTLSSSDEDDEDEWSNDVKSMIGPLSPEPAEEEAVCKNMLATYSSRPQFNGETAPELPRSPTIFTDNSLKEMIRNHRKRRWNGEVLPDLDTKGITFHDVLSRAQYLKKLALKLPAGSPGAVKKKVKVEKPESKKKKVKVKEEDDGKMAALSVDDDIEDEIDDEGVLPDDIIERIKDPPQEESAIDGTAPSFDEDEDEGMSDAKRLISASRAENYNKPYKSFFSLLKEFIIEEPESKTSTIKLEEKVREWQESPGPSLNPWAVTHPQWTDLVSSALKFLSGDVIGLSIDNFIPLLDYKERAQQWKWIAKGRDTDDALTPLFTHWMQHKSDMATEAAEQGNASPLPPRSRTSYVVQTSSSAEKLEFREQEQFRFDSPHKAFTYRMHGYESVVGPVKGVYSKDATINKARDHALLIKDRPSYVTILTLVRDAAARLPNGEGTRSDICELLKDSHFLAPGVSDHQINTVVSGALDRLHYEKDPCVKYDVNRKLWIYLHRHRSEAEFEKIHQAQGAAAKAKKALQRTKPAKKGKETPVSSTTVSIPSTSSVPTVSESLMMIEASNSAQGITSTSRNGPASPRITTQLSPRATLTTTKTVVPSGGKVVTATLPPAQTTKSAQISQVSTAGVTSSSKTSLVQMSGSPQAKSVSLAFLQPNAAGGATRLPSQNAASVLASNTQSQGQPRQAVPGSKPVAFSLIQSGVTNKISESVQSQSRTVLITSESEKAKQKLVSVTQPTQAPPAAKVRETIAKLTQQMAVQQAAGKLKQGAQASATSQGTTTIKIQGSSILASQAARVGKSAVDKGQRMTSTQASEVMGQEVTTPTTQQQTAAMLQKPVTQVALGRGGKPATLLITKPGSQPGTPTSVVATTLTGTETIAQLIQTSSLVGKPAVIGGKPIIIGGKPAVFSGKPIQLIQGKPGQFGVLQSNQASIVNLVSQAGATGTNVTMVTQAGGARIFQTSHTTSSGVTPTLVSQILQAGNPSILQPKVTTAQATAAGSAKQMVTMSTAQQQKYLSQAKQTKAGNKILTAGTSLMGSQIIVSPSQTPHKFVASQIIAAGKRGGVVPTLITSQAGRQNIQVVKTVLSQANPGKPAQTTFVLAQPGGQPITSVTQDHKVSGSVKSAKPTGPVYARIITPPPGVRLAAVRPGQAMHGVSVLQAADGAQILTQYAPSTVSTSAAQQEAMKSESTEDSQK